MAKVPFVVLIIGALAVGLGVTLWLSTAAAQRSYQLSTARATNDALSQQKEALERDVLEAQSAPALAEAARNLGMIPSKDTAHLVQDPMGNWIVVGKPKPAEGAPPPPLNNKLPDEKPPAPPAPAAPAVPNPKPGSAPEVPTRLTPLAPGAVPLAGTEVPVHLPAATLPGPALAPGLNLVPVPVGGPPATDLPPAAVVPAPWPRRPRRLPPSRRRPLFRRRPRTSCPPRRSPELPSEPHRQDQGRQGQAPARSGPRTPGEVPPHP